MKRLFSMMFSLFIILFLTSCGKPADASIETDAPASVKTAKYEEPQLIAEARALGIVDDSISNDMDANITQKDMAVLLKNAYTMQYGKDFSSILEYYVDTASSSENATRIYMASMLYNARIQFALHKNYSSFDAFQAEKNELLASESGRWYVYFQSGIIAEKADGSVGMFDLEVDCADVDEIQTNGDMDAVKYATFSFDRRTEDRLMQYDENRCFRPLDGMTVYDAISLAYHYYYSLEPVPRYVDVDQVGTYNADIITASILENAPTLPEASNASLPAWKGFNRQYMTTMMGSGEEGNYWVTKSEIETMASTGANFLRLWISFSAFEAPTYGDNNQVNLYYLEHLDEILAWCVENGLHLQVSVVNGPGLNYQTYPEDEKRLTDERLFNDETYRDQCLKWYQMLARRYAAIPNKCFSINLLNEPENAQDDEHYANTFAPIIDAIWQESPERLIVADVCGNITGEAMAKLGVALSCHSYKPNDIMTVFRNEDAERVVNTVWSGPYLPAILYSQEGAGWYNYPNTVWERGNKITGNISGTLEIMASDISMGSAVLRVEADGVVLYEDTPPYEIAGDDVETGICYSTHPVVLPIPDGASEITLSCTQGIITLPSIVLKRTDGESVSITCISDDWGGEAPCTVKLLEDGTYTSERQLTAQQVISKRYGGSHSIMEVKQLADQYGVGFMIGEFGIFGDFYLNYGMNDETISAIYTDFVQTFDELHIPWATNWLVDRYSIAIAYPYYSDRSYQRISDSEFYMDEYMFELFRKLINR